MFNFFSDLPHNVPVNIKIRDLKIVDLINTIEK